jgi:enoyl-CoA hydratase/carnithine racemase
LASGLASVDASSRAFGVLPGGGAAQHLVRLIGRGRALEVMLSAEDYDAELAERYGWINRAVPADVLSGFVKALAHRGIDRHGTIPRGAELQTIPVQ